MSINDFNIAVSDADLSDLKQRLALSRLPTQLEGDDNTVFGSTVDDVSRLTSYWRTAYDWRKAEASLNELPNFKTDINVDGFGDLSIHFLHQKSSVEGAIPLMFSHGWPGSFLEVTKMLPDLVRGGEGRPAFHVVAPSLPNFGFSQGVTKKGFGLTKYAETCHKLMLKLGYDKYVTQGGDWGFGVVRAIGLQYPEHCMASHLNLVLAKPPKVTEAPMQAFWHAITPYNAREQVGMEQNAWFDNESFGYNILQSTKPQTIGFALHDSPVALLAWIYEKLRDWSDKYPWTDDEILTWVSLYWFSTAGPAASVRIYHEATHPRPQSNIGTLELMNWQPTVPLGFSHFPAEIRVVPKTWAVTLGPTVFQSEHESGGHFAAWEKPKELASDLQKMFGKGGPCFGVVDGKSGYAS